MSTSDLPSLLARVEAATGPTFALERSLFEAFDIPDKWFGSRVVSFFCNGGGYGFNTEDGFRHLDCVRVPPYTVSLDAALALCERVLPGLESWKLEPRWARVYVPDHAYSSNTAATTPLALLAAMLKALIAQGAKPDLSDPENPEWTEADVARARGPDTLPAEVLAPFPKTTTKPD